MGGATNKVEVENFMVNISQNATSSFIIGLSNQFPKTNRAYPTVGTLQIYCRRMNISTMHKIKIVRMHMLKSK